MKRKQRFIVFFAKIPKEAFLNMADKATKGIAGNPDFTAAPVSAADFMAAYKQMLAAAPLAVRKDINGMRTFKPLRKTVEGMMTKLANYAQSTIGDLPDRMEASCLPLSKEPQKRSEDINLPVEKAKVEQGESVGKIKVSVKPLKAADGIVIEERQPDLSFKEVARVPGFKASLSGYTENQVVVLQICYWSKQGTGPMMAKPLAIVV